VFRPRRTKRKRVSFGETMDPSTPRPNEIVYEPVHHRGVFPAACVAGLSSTTRVIGLHHYGDSVERPNRAFTAQALRAHAGGAISLKAARRLILIAGKAGGNSRTSFARTVVAGDARPTLSSRRALVTDFDRIRKEAPPEPQENLFGGRARRDRGLSHARAASWC